MNAHQPYIFLLLGTTHRANTLAEASATFSATRDATGLGSREMPLPHIEQGGAVVGHFSYNGRIWAQPPKDWKPGAAPIFDNAVSEAAR